MAGAVDGSLPKLRRDAPAGQSRIREYRAGSFPHIVRMWTRVIESSGRSFAVDRRGAIREFDVIGMLAEGLVEETKCQIDVRSELAGDVCDFGPRFQIEDVIVHRVPLAIIERTPIG